MRVFHPISSDSSSERMVRFSENGRFGVMLKGEKRRIWRNFWNRRFKVRWAKIKIRIAFWRRTFGSNVLYAVHEQKIKRFWEFSDIGRGFRTFVAISFYYPENSQEVKDKIVCAQFVTALSDGFVRITLQLEGVTSLKMAIKEQWQLEWFKRIILKARF